MRGGRAREKHGDSLNWLEPVKDAFLAMGICAGILSIVYFSGESFKERFVSGSEKRLNMPSQVTGADTQYRSSASGHRSAAARNQKSDIRRGTNQSKPLNGFISDFPGDKKGTFSIYKPARETSIPTEYRSILSKHNLSPETFQSRNHRIVRNRTSRTGKTLFAPVHCAGFRVLTSCQSVMDAKARVNEMQRIRSTQYLRDCQLQLSKARHKLCR